MRLPSSTINPVHAGLMFTLLVTGGTWLWSLSSRISEIRVVSDRVTVLEATDTTRSDKLNTMSERLARIEPMLAFLVDQARGVRKP